MNQTYDSQSSFPRRPREGGGPGPLVWSQLPLGARFRGHDEKGAGTKRQIHATRSIYPNRCPTVLRSRMPILGRGFCLERYGGGSIVVSDYDAAWSAMFEQERRSLHTALGPLVLTIEHIGSTAVPGLAAKPIIDLQASVRSLAEPQSRCVEPLQALGYTYLPKYEAWLPGELFFRKALAGPWTHRLHIFQGDDPGGRTAFCFVTICATIRRQQPPTPS